MLKEAEVYYFSPTGGTKKVAETLANALAQNPVMIDLGKQPQEQRKSTCDVVIAAVPVFGGRVPAVAAEKLKQVQGAGRKAITVAVYGNRAYDDALLEVNDILTASGFHVIASGAFIARHSMVPEVAQGRPDANDLHEIRAFADTILNLLKKDSIGQVTVPGHFPYKESMNMPATPVSLPSCTHCRQCMEVCPVDAITIKDAIVTNPETCILCMACTAVCPKQARILPPALSENLNQKLGALKNVRRENEVFLADS